MGITSSQPADEVDFGTSSSESGMKTTFEIFWNPVPFHPFLSSLYLRKSMNSAEECFICIALSQDSTRSIVRHSKWTRKNLQTLNVTPALTFPCSRMLFFLHTFIHFCRYEMIRVCWGSRCAVGPAFNHYVSLAACRDKPTGRLIRRNLSFGAHIHSCGSFEASVYLNKKADRGWQE